MTILTKSNIAVKNSDVIKIPLVDESALNDDKIEVYSSTARKSSGALWCLSIVAFLVAILGITSGLMLYGQYLRNNNTPLPRFSGFCAIPLAKDLQGMGSASYRQAVPLVWTATEPAASPLDPEQEEYMSTVNEQLDIADGVEKITVYNKGHVASFIHDFNTNFSGIVDLERCYTMELDAALALRPDQFLLAIERGEPFDIARVHSDLQAVLPALQYIAHLNRVFVENCQDKPTYKLQKNEGVVIRKRSTIEPKPDFVQFSGNRVQEIVINNLADIIQYEGQHRNNQ